MTTILVLELEKEHVDIGLVNEEIAMFTLYVSEFEDDLEENKEYIKQWIGMNCDFPLQVVLTTYQEGTQDDIFQEHGFSFDHYVKGLESTNIYKIKVETLSQVSFLLDTYYWLAAQNETFIIADPATEISIEEHAVYRYITMDATLSEHHGVLLKVEHDGQGVQLITTKKDWMYREGLQQTLGSVHIEQWGEEYYGLADSYIS